MEGQMWPEERKLLHNAVLDCKPAVVLEVGTWKGGGSTLQITSALLKNASQSDTPTSGVLHTCELDSSLYEEAKRNYDGIPESNHVKFYNQSSDQLIGHLIENGEAEKLGFIFFDGPEDPDVSINDFMTLDKYLQIGTFFCMHDWDPMLGPDGPRSTKALRLRPYLENLGTWETIKTLTYPDSVGIVLAKKISI